MGSSASSIRHQSQWAPGLTVKDVEVSHTVQLSATQGAQQKQSAMQLCTSGRLFYYLVTVRSGALEDVAELDILLFSCSG